VLCQITPSLKKTLRNRKLRTRQIFASGISEDFAAKSAELSAGAEIAASLIYSIIAKPAVTRSSFPPRVTHAERPHSSQKSETV
jgi:hypothetical protein